MENLFGKIFESIGTTQLNFLIKTKGLLKILYGNKYIDLIKDGKINIDLLFIKKINSEDLIIKDGFYYNTSNGNVYVKIDSNILCLYLNTDSIYVSFNSKQETTELQKILALSNIGLYYETLDLAIKDLQNGFVYIESENMPYIIKDGKGYKLDSNFNNPFNSELIIGENGKLTLIGKGDSKGISINTSLIYSNNNILTLKAISGLQAIINNNQVALFLDILTTLFTDLKVNNNINCNHILSIGANDTQGFRLYVLNGVSTLEVDNIIQRKETLSYNVTYNEFLTLITDKTISTNTYYRIIDFCNYWEFFYERINGNIIESLIPIRKLVIYINKKGLVEKAWFESNPEWDIIYDYTQNDTFYAPVYENGIYLNVTEIANLRGVIVLLTDEYNNTCNYDFKHLMFKVDGINYYTLPETSINNNIFINNIKIENSTSVLCEGNYCVVQNESYNNKCKLNNSNLFVSSSNFNNNDLNFNNSNSVIDNLFINNTIRDILLDFNPKGILLNNQIFSISNTQINSNIEDTLILGDFTNNVLNGDILKCRFLHSVNNLTIYGAYNCSFDFIEDVTIPESITNSTFHDTISNKIFSKTDDSVLFIEDKTKDIYFNNGKVVVLCVPDVVFYRGMIIMYNGELPIPYGWAICDGNNGTPNLIGRFIKAGTSIGEIPSDLNEDNELVIKLENLPIHSHPHKEHTHDIQFENAYGTTSTETVNVSSSDTFDYLLSSSSTSVVDSVSGDGITSSSTSVINSVSASYETVHSSGGHSHTVSLDNLSATLSKELSTEISLTSLDYPNKPIKIEPRSYSLIFIMKL